MKTAYLFNLSKTLCYSKYNLISYNSNFYNNIKQLSENNYKIFIIILRRQGILPIVYKNLQFIYKQTQKKELQDLIDILKPHYLNISKKNILLSSELIYLSKILNKNNIKFISFKGPTLSKIAYGDITIRQYSDLDILIQKKDFIYIANVLISKGFKPLYPIDTFIDNKVMFEMNNDCPFYDSKRGISIEVHWDFFRKLALNTKKFKPWQNIQTININNYNLYILQNETYLVYHTLHASKHIWERLEWIVDVDRFIRAIPTLDWDKMINMAKELGALKMFLLGIYLSKHYFDTPIPKYIDNLCKKTNLHNIPAFIEEEFHEDNPSPEDSLTKLIKVIQLRDNLYYKTLTILEFIFKPGINERRMIILSDKWFWLYWIIRPFGISYRFIKNRIFNYV